jgi:hypothetical protein
MQDANAAVNQRIALPSMRAYLALIGTAAVSGLAMHMVRHTAAADMPALSAQRLTLPIDLQHGAIDTSLAPIGL